MDDEALETFEKLRNNDVAEISYKQGLFHMAAAIASNFRDDKSLGTSEMKSEIPTQMYTCALNRGGLINPTIDWLADVTKMDQMFIEHHPKDRLNKGVGLTEDFNKLLQIAFPNRNIEILEYFTRVRTRARIRHMNRRIMAPKRGTLRGLRKKVEWLF